MDHGARIAVLEVDPSALAGDLRALPSRPEVRRFTDLFADIASLAEFRPRVLCVRMDEPDPERIGGLRTARPLIGDPSVVLVADASREVALAPVAGTLGARLLLLPYRPRDLTAALGQALAGSDRPQEEVFLDIARGLADEINNPLMYLSGYLQLLGQSFDPRMERDRIDQLTAAKEGVSRIAATVEKIRLLSRVTALQDPETDVDVCGLLEQARVGAGAGVELRIPGDLGSGTVPGYEPALTAAVQDLVRVGGQFVGLGCRTVLSVRESDHGLHLQMEVQGAGLGEWQLPRTFEPYYLNRVLRGTPHGLALFLVQTVVHAHGGEALARRREDGTLVLDLLLPR